MARRALVAVLALVVLASARADAQPAEASGGWVLEVQEGEVFRAAGPQANLTGPGRIVVHGTLVLEGDPRAPSLLDDVAILIHSEGPHRIANVRIRAPAEVAIDAAGALALEDVAIEGGAIGVLARGEARLAVERARFDAQADAALSLADNASARVRGATFTGGGDGIRSHTRGALDVESSTFRTLREQGAVRLPAGAADARFVNNSFASPTGATARACLLLDAEGAARADLSMNRFRGCGVGLAATGAALRVESGNDTFLSNGVAVRVSDAEVRLVRAIFGTNARDFDGQVILEEPTFISAAPAPAPTPGPPATQPENEPPPAGVDARTVMLGATLLLLGLAAVGYLARARLATLGARLRARWLAPELREEARARVRDSLEGAASLSPEDVSRRAGLTRSLTEAILDEMAHEGAVEIRNPGGSDGELPRYRLAAPAAGPGAPPADLAAPLKPQEARILRDVADHPGTPQSAVAHRLGLSRQALHYHVKKLEARGLITKSAKGRETHCYVRPEALPLLEAAREVPVQEAAPAPEAAPDVVPAGDTHAGSGERP